MSTTLDLNPTAPRPPEETAPLTDRRQTNPMFNDQKMKLGLFGTNCSYGLIMSHIDSTYRVTWEHTREIARRADALGFEAIVPIARWKGFGGTTNFNGNCFETYTYAQGSPRRRRTSRSSRRPTSPPSIRSWRRRWRRPSTTSRAGASA